MTSLKRLEVYYTILTTIFLDFFENFFFVLKKKKNEKSTYRRLSLIILRFYRDIDQPDLTKNKDLIERRYFFLKKKIEKSIF